MIGNGSCTTSQTQRLSGGGKQSILREALSRPGTIRWYDQLSTRSFRARDTMGRTEKRTHRVSGMEFSFSEPYFMCSPPHGVSLRPSRTKTSIYECRAAFLCDSKPLIYVVEIFMLVPDQGWYSLCREYCTILCDNVGKRDLFSGTNRFSTPQSRRRTSSNRIQPLPKEALALTDTDLTSSNTKPVIRGIWLGGTAALKKGPTEPHSNFYPILHLLSSCL